MRTKGGFQLKEKKCQFLVLYAPPQPAAELPLFFVNLKQEMNDINHRILSPENT